MQQSTITYLATPDPGAPTTPNSSSPVEETYLIATDDGTSVSFEHKLILTDEGALLQVVTKDNRGEFTVALDENAFPIDDEFVGIELLAPDSTQYGTEYSVRIFKDSSTENPDADSEVWLAANRSPQITMAMVAHDNGSSIVQELNFIGTTDIRIGFTAARTLIRPGETVYVQLQSGGDFVVLRF